MMSNSDPDWFRCKFCKGRKEVFQLRAELKQHLREVHMGALLTRDKNSGLGTSNGPLCSMPPPNSESSTTTVIDLTDEEESLPESDSTGEPVVCVPKLAVDSTTTPTVVASKDCAVISEEYRSGSFQSEINKSAQEISSSSVSRTVSTTSHVTAPAGVPAKGKRKCEDEVTNREKSPKLQLSKDHTCSASKGTKVLDLRLNTNCGTLDQKILAPASIVGSDSVPKLVDGTERMEGSGRDAHHGKVNERKVVLIKENLTLEAEVAGVLNELKSKSVRLHSFKDVKAVERACGTKRRRNYGKKLPWYDRQIVQKRRKLLGTQVRCKKCSKMLPSLVALREHAATHEGEQPLECPQCKSKFWGEASLRRHLKTKHTISSTSSPEKGKRMLGKAYTCKDCSATFRRSETLRGHLRNVHNVKDVSDAVLLPGINRAASEGSVRSHHGDDEGTSSLKLNESARKRERETTPPPEVYVYRGKFMCSTCNTAFSSERAWDLHYRQVHCVHSQIDGNAMEKQENNLQSDQIAAIPRKSSSPLKSPRREISSQGSSHVARESVKSTETPAKRVKKASVSQDGSNHSDVFICQYCPKKYSLRVALNRHIKTIHSEKQVAEVTSETDENHSDASSKTNRDIPIVPLKTSALPSRGGEIPVHSKDSKAMIKIPVPPTESCDSKVDLHKPLETRETSVNSCSVRDSSSGLHKNSKNNNSSLSFSTQSDNLDRYVKVRCTVCQEFLPKLCLASHMKIHEDNKQSETTVPTSALNSEHKTGSSPQNLDDIKEPVLPAKPQSTPDTSNSNLKIKEKPCGPKPGSHKRPFKLTLRDPTSLTPKTRKLGKEKVREGSGSIVNTHKSEQLESNSISAEKLKKHAKNDTKPFTCSYCNRKFSYKKWYLSHIELEHPNEERQSNTGKNNEIAPSLNREIDSTEQVFAEKDDNVESLSSNDNAVECQIYTCIFCDEELSERQTLEKHLMGVHRMTREKMEIFLKSTHPVPSVPHRRHSSASTEVIASDDSNDRRVSPSIVENPSAAGPGHSVTSGLASSNSEHKSSSTTNKKLRKSLPNRSTPSVPMKKMVKLTPRKYPAVSFPISGRGPKSGSPYKSKVHRRSGKEISSKKKGEGSHGKQAVAKAGDGSNVPAPEYASSPSVLFQNLTPEAIEYCAETQKFTVKMSLPPQVQQALEYLRGANNGSGIDPLGLISGGAKETTTRPNEKTAEKSPRKTSKKKTPMTDVEHTFVQCPHCPMRYGTRAQVTDHVISAHSNEAKVIPCPHCEKEYKTHGRLNNHIDKCHSKL